MFAELEAEIENDDGPLREQGLKELQREYGGAVYLFPQVSLLSGYGFYCVKDGPLEADA